jgi:crotonobetainyl-CoA:carnitine CoA-transferase CaiB-like acyl-CoA transferase
MTKALEGIKVLDFSMGVAGPHAGMLCAQHGADVIKVESPEGDWGRRLGDPHGDLTAYFTVYNRGKRSLALDMKDPQALAAVRRLAADADIVIDAFRPGVMRRLGLDYDSLKATNPRVIYLSVTGFGPQGPLSAAPATDAVLQAFTGMMDANKDEAGKPQRLNMFLIDIVTGLYGFQAITAAMLERQRTGRGKWIDCSLMKSALALQAPMIAEKMIDPDFDMVFVPLGAMRALDGHLSISVLRDEQFTALCRALGRDDFAGSDKYTTRAQRVLHKNEVMGMLEAEFAKRTIAELSALLTTADVLHAKVQDFTETVRHEQVVAVGALAWTRQPGLDGDFPTAVIPGTPPGAAEGASSAPHIGEHSISILKSAGLEDTEIQDLVQRGKVLLPASALA